MRTRRGWGLGAGGWAILLVATLVTHGVAQGSLQPYKDPAGRFTIQYPRRNWIALPGGGLTLATFAENKGKATIQIEYLALKQPLDAKADYDIIVEIESELVKERQPGVGATKSQPFSERLPGIVVLDYERPGTAGPDRVRQYSVVKGQNLFRILCIASRTEFPKFEGTFDQMARGFAVTVAATS